MRFPELTARDLDGRPVTLPTDLGSDPTLLLVRFASYPGHDVETWLPSVSELAESVSPFWCYDLLVLPEFPVEVQASLTNELGTLADRADAFGVRSLTTHTDLDAFRRALVLDRAAQTYALVLRDGRVRWRAFGPLTTPLERRLRAAVTALDSDVNDSTDLVVS